MNRQCFHCNEAIPTGINLSVEINNTQQPMCCIGCQAIAQTIVDNGLTQYYAVRTEPAHKGQPLVPEQLQKNKLLDEAVLQSEFIFNTSINPNAPQSGSQNINCKEAILTVDGISCAACAWLIEMQLDKLPGLININVNATSQRATVKWQDNKVKLSEILLAIENIGYHAMPFKANDVEISNKKQNKTFIKRLGISGILMMQVMMVAISLYFGAFFDMTESNILYLRWVSFILTTPIIFYGAFPFYNGAIKAIKVKRLSMDVPVSIAIILAFSASAWATITQQGEVYFESVSMFTFLLLIGKFLEFRARSRAAQVSANLLKMMPLTAIKLVTITDTSIQTKSKKAINNSEVLIAAKQLVKGDFVIIKPGEVVPADGIIISGTSQLNEAMLSGEQLPISKTVNDKVFAGTINGDGNITVEVKNTSNHSFLSQLIRLSESSQAHKPKIAQLSDKIAQYFVALILLTSIATAIYWQQHMPEQAFWITLSVLVATCPCALSLATPTGLTCATTRLNKAGIMIKGGHVMETMPNVNCFAFDKTGTLTTGEFSISDIRLTTDNKEYTKEKLLAIASVLEAHSEHPIAKPFTKYRDNNLIAKQVEVHSGKGVSGSIDGVDYAIGKYTWLTEAKNDPENEKLSSDIKVANCLLMANKKIIAAFYLVDEIRDDTFSLISQLNQNNKTLLLSGDSQSACDAIAKQIPLNETFGGLSAKDKMNKIKDAETKGYTVAMTGDGVNDSPVFGAAHISIAMGCGADITKSGADVILLNNKLNSINTLITVSHRTRRIIFQNYLWAFGYNAIVLPLAVMGYITPYMAVIGMSASSILVITNSLRLLKK